MHTELSVTKSLLAKLLAGENINVIHCQRETAGFDTATRTLYLPIWENMDGELYDLLGGHEVGHALYTPNEGWHSETHDKDGNFLRTFKNVLNICEDARIEKKIKRTYPGLSKSFVAGYKNLYERDLFGIKELKDLSKLNILDRINLYCKCGSFLILPFSDEEKVLLREVQETETWDQVVEVAKKLFEFAKKEEDKQLNSLEDLTEELMRQLAQADKSEDAGDPQEGDSAEKFMKQLAEKMADEIEKTLDEDAASDSGEDSGEDTDDDTGKGDEGEETNPKPAAGDSDEEGDEEDTSTSKGEGDEDDDGDDTSDNGAGHGGEGSDEKEPRSITDEIFREREKELLSTSDIEIFTYNLPKPILENIIVPNKIWADNFYETVINAQKAYGNKDPIIATCSKKFTERNKRYVNLLVKEFEMRKNARQYARTTVAKTGELDMAKLHQYKFTNDLFRKISHVQKGKSHGMMIYVDMSGSMSYCFASTMEQMLILAAFCRKVNVPFDIYGFSDRGDYLQMLTNKRKFSANREQKFMKSAGDTYSIIDGGFHLVQLLSSRVQGTSYRRAFDMCCVAAYNWKNKMYPRCHISWGQTGLDLGGTPFTQAVMASRPIIDKFKADNKVDIVNVIYLTDGDGTGCFRFNIKVGVWNTATSSRAEQRIYMIDPKSKIRIDLGNPGEASLHQQAMTAFVRQVTGCKHIGYYIAGSAGAKNRIRAMNGYDFSKLADLDKFWRNNGWYAVPCYGYDQYYFIRDAALDATDEDYKIDSETMSVKKMAKTFSDAQADKRKHRVLVSKFAQDIAA